MITPAHLYFGALAVRNGFASSSEIELALEAQKEGPAFENDAPLKLGEILAEMGTLTPAQVRTLLETQDRLRKEPASDLESTSTSIPFVEIESLSLLQESGPPPSVNGEPLNGPRTLKPGDRLQAGELQFRVSGGSIEIRPPEAAPAAEPKSEAAPPAAPKPSLAARILPALRAVDGLIARIPPALHTQRKYVIAAALLGGIAFLLPWRIAGNGNSVLGVQGPGWLPFLLALVPAALTLFTRPGDPFTRAERIGSSAAAGLALLIVLAKFLFPPAYATARGIGLYLFFLSAAALLAAGAFPRAGGGGPASDVPTLGARLWKTLRGFAGSVSGRRARELNVAMEQRDALLRRIGEAALASHPSLPEAAAAIQAREALQKAEQEAADPASQVRAKAAQKAADAKAKRAFAKLAQRALEGGTPPPGQDATIADLRAAEARIKELS